MRWCYFHKKEVGRFTCISCVYYDDHSDSENSTSEDDPCTY